MKLFRSAPRPTLCVLLLLACAAPLAAITKPPASIAKPKLGRMVDARVNLSEAFSAAARARAIDLKAGLAAARQEVRSMAEAQVALKRAIPGLDVQVSGLTGGPEVVRNRAGALTGINPGARSEEIVREFLTRNGRVYGLNAVDLNDLVALGDSPGGGSGLRMLRMEQRIGGRPVFQSETRFVLDRDGRLIESLGRMVPGARDHVSQWKAAASLTPAEAVVRLLATQHHTATADRFTVINRRGDGFIELSENDDLVAGTVYAREVLFPLSPGLLVPAWSLVIFTEGEEDWYGLIDQETGALLWRKNIRNYVSTHEARFRVYVQADGKTPADSPAPQSPTPAAPLGNQQFAEIAPTIVNMLTVQDVTASPNGWIDDCPGGGCTANETQTLGNNVLACMDRAGTANVCDTDTASQLDGNGRPTGNPDANTRNRDFLGTTPRDFQTNFTPPPQGGAANAEVGQTSTGAGNGTSTGPTDIFRRGVVTQLFYVANWYHDQLFALGFDEASANFQATNFSGMGLGGDRVLADAQDASGTNNANFATPPDGVSGRAQMFRFTGPTIDRDGDLDSEILIHELSHGLSNRLVGNAAGLNWDPAGGMGEGWSDFYALSLLNNTNADTPSGNYASGAYATFKLGGLQDNYVYGIRRFPYSTNNAVNPMTWADADDVTNSLTGGIAADPLGFNFNGGMEVHNAGEIWALTLWEVRERIIADPAGANGSVPTGNLTTLQIVTDALKLTPIDPSFINARDALFTADCAANACANEMSIWGGFADRGLGYRARADFNVLFGFGAGHLGVHESFVSPYLDVVDPSTDVAANDSLGNNNGAIDPGEPIQMTVTLTNPWRAASKAVASATAVLSTTTPGVTITDPNSTYGPIAPQGTATGDTFSFTLSQAALCGSAIDFTITTTSSLGTTAATFRVRIGAASGTDPVVTYTKNTTPDLAIPDNTPLAVHDTQTITDDFEIADLDLRLDSATHTFTGDLTFMLRSPGGLGVDQISLIGGLTDGGPGDNITNMRIDSDQPQDVAHDMVQIPNTNTAAPYTGSWSPVFDSPWPVVAGFPAKNPPTKDLDIYDGESTLGTWSLAASDQFAADTGTLNAWSILVTPVHFVCQGFTPTTTVTATKTVAGTFSVGGTVTYTVVLTNTGNTAQADNATNEFLDDLPATLTLTNATATSGTATFNVVPNQVTWNGTIAANGGTVTLTITATINPAGAGQSKCNQGTASFDSDVNGSNESTALTDDPAVGGATDPTCFPVAGIPVLSATKTATGSFTNGSVVTYTIVISNTGTAASPDNAGNEFTDTLPAGLTVGTPTASAGTVSGAGINPVTWSGSVPGPGSVTITIPATINAAVGATLTNQGSVSYDADGNGSNETTVQTDDPVPAGGADPTSFVVAGGVIAVPTLDEVGLAILALALLSAAWLALRKRKQTA